MSEPTFYKSRKRLTEQAMREALSSFAGTHVDDVQILIGRETIEQDVTNIRIHCGDSEPVDNDMSLPIYQWKVSGVITVQTSADDMGREEISTLEGVIETFIEQNPDDMAVLLDQTSVEDFGCWDFQPGSNEDGLDEEKRHYMTAYSFEAIVLRTKIHNQGE